MKRLRTNRPLCECGCGKKVKWNRQKEKWNRFLYCHNRRGKKLTEEHKRKLYSKESRKKNSDAQKKRTRNAEEKKKQSERMLRIWGDSEFRKKMKKISHA